MQVTQRGNKRKTEEREETNRKQTNKLADLGASLPRSRFKCK